MREIELQTSSGGFVVRGRIPAFLKHPQVVLWGDRVFMFYGDSNGPVYRETFAVALVDAQV